MEIYNILIEKQLIANVNINFINNFFFFQQFSVYSLLLHKRTYLEPSIVCSSLHASNNSSSTRLESVIRDHRQHRSTTRLRIDPKVLVFVETTYSRLGREIAELFVYNRIK